MSQKEMDAMDAQVMDIANRVPKTEDREGCGSCAPHNAIGGKYEDAVSAERCRQVLWTVIKMLACVLIGALFVVALVDPGFVVCLVNVGVLACGIAAAVILDRFLRRC